MPVEHSVDPDEWLVFSRAFETINDRDLLNQRRRLEAHPHFKSYFNQLFEFTEVSTVEVSQQGVALLAERYPFGKRSRRALVVAPNALAVREMAFLFKVLDEQYPDKRRARFEGVEAARRWLQVPVQEL